MRTSILLPHDPEMAAGMARKIGRNSEKRPRRLVDCRRLPGVPESKPCKNGLRAQIDSALDGLEARRPRTRQFDIGLDRLGELIGRARLR